MRRRAERTSALPIKAAYTVGELAAAAGMTWQSTERLLLTNGVQFERSGRAPYVPLAELEKKMPMFWESLKLVALLKRAVGA
jgi:hypothetical protein